MLDAVAGNFLDAVSEREFDAPLIALLRSHGFEEIHFLHGQYEYGKDVIARKVSPDTQFVVQSKAGNVGLAEWMAMRGQIDVLRTNELAHPSFNSTLPRIGVLVLTGRLTGGAPLEVQDYSRRALENGETPLEVWDRERLIEMIAATPEAGLAGTVEGPLLELLGHVDGGRVTEAELESYSTRWIRDGAVLSWSAVLEASIVATRLRQAQRVDLACFAALSLLRGVWASTHGVEPAPDEGFIQGGVARDMFMTYAEEIWQQCAEELLDARHFISLDDEGVFLTYPVRCLRLIELLGLYALALEDAERRAEVREWIRRFVESQPGAAHPISDRWAVSLIPPLLVLGRERSSEREALLREVIRWLGKRHDEDNLGLAPADASPNEESEYLLGGSLDHVELSPRRSSYLAAVVLDLCAAFELSDAYDVAYNDIAAVDVTPQVPLPNDDGGQYLATGADVPLDTSPRYCENWVDGDGWRMAPHEDEDLDRYYLGRLGRAWDHLAICAVLRDRHWVAAIRVMDAAT